MVGTAREPLPCVEGVSRAAGLVPRAPPQRHSETVAGADLGVNIDAPDFSGMLLNMTRTPPQSAAALEVYLQRISTSLHVAASDCGVPLRSLQRWMSGQSRCPLWAALAIEAWSCGGVRAAGWLTESERRKLAAIRLSESS